MADNKLTLREFLEIEIETLSLKCQEIFESNKYEGNHFDNFIEKWDFNSRYELSPSSYDRRTDRQLVEMKVDLLAAYIDMQVSI